jgi:hypothetical protein
VLGGFEIGRLAQQILGHVGQDQSDARVKLAVCKLTAMLGIAPKLLRRRSHRKQDSHKLVLFRDIFAAAALFPGGVAIAQLWSVQAWWMALTTW